MKSPQRLLLLSSCAAVIFISTVHGQNATTVSATGCVSVSGMQTCLNTANTNYEKCMAVAGGDDELVIACGWAKSVDQIGCYLESCWNKVGRLQEQSSIQWR